MEDQLLHIGVKRRSGRYEWGSGQNPYQHESWYFLRNVDGMREKGMSDTEIARQLGMSTTAFRSKVTWANREVDTIRRQVAWSMHEQGYSNVDIGQKLGVSEGTIRNILTTRTSNTTVKLNNTIEALKRGVENVGYLDVSAGVEHQLGISKERLKAARQKLLDEGYFEHTVYVKNMMNPNKWTTIKVLTKEADLNVVKKHIFDIRSLEEWSGDGGRTWDIIKPPTNIDWDRVHIRYAEDGGEGKDGLMEIRRGAEDLDLGASRYAQVRIAVGGTHYLKGMAIHSDGKFPDGVDIIFNTNKGKNTPKQDVLKKLSDNKDNPFGSWIERQNGALNIVNEEGSWAKWKGTLSSQMLSKQPLKLIRERLDATYSKLKGDYDEIMSLTNPTLKKFLLETHVSSLDSATRMLKAKGLARTKNHVILPFPDMDPAQIYAPNYKNGERVVLIRHPHGGIFEIPELVVNNRGSAKSVLGNAIDAVGIHPSVAKKLSGADFDGDTVLVIPNDHGKIKSSRSLSQLKNFDTMTYRTDNPTYKDNRKGKAAQQIEMGSVSNLITDMTIKGAPSYEIVRAVKHSMVVIDSVKHSLDARLSAKENDIASLKKKYQSHIDGQTGNRSSGASTIVSKAKSDISISRLPKDVASKLKREDIRVNKYKEKVVYRMDAAEDARQLSSGTAKEEAYASYANKVKALSNTAAKQAKSIPPIKRDPAAAKFYSNEVKSLNDKLREAQLNAPRERQAQLLATKTYRKNLDPSMTPDDKKKLSRQALADARAKTIPGGKKATISITPKEWTAIQSGAISNDRLRQILEHSDLDQVRKYATPKTSTKLSTAMLTRANSMLSRGYSYGEVAQALGTTTTIIRDNLKERDLP